jgi:hypothetical protein
MDTNDIKDDEYEKAEWPSGKHATVRDLLTLMTGYALEHAELAGVKLDFSHESIKRVDTVLGEFRKRYGKTLDARGALTVALEYACYIVSTVLLSFEEGDFGIDHPVYGEKTFPFYWKGSILFPRTWCLNVVTEAEGKAKTIWELYEEHVLRAY